MKIIVAGLPDIKTRRTLMTVEEVVAKSRHIIQVEWISDVHEMGKLGVKHLPTVIVNQDVRVESRIPSMYEVQTWIEEELAETIAA